MLAALGEAATGLVLLVYPALVAGLLIGAEIAGVGLVMSRVAGLALIALGIACWPRRDGGNAAAFSAMLTYSTMAALYLGYLGLGGAWVGVLLWPAVVIHVLFSLLLVRAWHGERRKRGMQIRYAQW